jgi:hypothetical protein
VFLQDVQISANVILCTASRRGTFAAQLLRYCKFLKSASSDCVCSENSARSLFRVWHVAELRGRLCSFAVTSIRQNHFFFRPPHKEAALQPLSPTAGVHVCMCAAPHSSAARCRITLCQPDRSHISRPFASSSTCRQCSNVTSSCPGLLSVLFCQQQSAANTERLSVSPPTLTTILCPSHSRQQNIPIRSTQLPTVS